MSPEEFDEVMRQLSCACCDSTMEVTYVNDVPFHQGGVLLQKVPATKQGVAGWAVIKQALCSNCLEQLQALLQVPGLLLQGLLPVAQELPLPLAVGRLHAMFL